MRHAFGLRVGPVGFRIGSDWAAPIAALSDLYAGYPAPSDGIPDFTVRLYAEHCWRRWLRPAIALGGDFVLPDAAPLPLAQGLLAAEMAMNLQLALGERRYLLLHASVVERDGRAIVMSGLSGAGKSTLALMLAAHGWRLLGDEFALIDPATGLVHPFPRLVSLKNRAIAIAEAALPDARFGPLMAATPKGDIRHAVPPGDAVARMDEPAAPALLLFPRYGLPVAERPIAASETFVRLTQASTNYVALGERGFAALTTLVGAVPGIAIDYPDTKAAVAAITALWARL